MIRYTTVTVVYEGDAMLLALQARSLARHVDHDLLSEIIVVDNTRRGLPRESVEGALRDYGPLAPLVRVVPARRFLPAAVAPGWWGQQLLKIVVAASVTTERCLVLDTKNIVVHRLGRDFLESPDGRARMVVQPYGAHPLRENLRVCLRWWGLDPEPHLARFGSTATPFVMETTLVRAMVAEVERRTGRSFAAAFRAQDVTDFLFYLAWICSRGDLEDVYAPGRLRCPVVWPGSPDVATLRREVDESERLRAPFLTVHQRALKDFDAERAAVLGAAWVRAGLFGSTEEGAAFVVRFCGAWRSPSSRLALLRARALGLARRLGQRRPSWVQSVGAR